MAEVLRLGQGAFAPWLLLLIETKMLVTVNRKVFVLNPGTVYLIHASESREEYVFPRTYHMLFLWPEMKTDP